MTHAHLLQMGGFKVHVTDEDSDMLKNEYCFRQHEKYGINVVEAPLLYDNFIQLLDNGKISFPEIKEDEITDRSKSDALSKGIALLQITWFIVQLIARARQHMTITEIELTTAALAGLNSIMYLFWWSKPFDVQCSIVIRTKKLEKLLVEKAEQDQQNWTFPNRSNFRLSTLRSLFYPLRNDFDHPERCVWTIPQFSSHATCKT